MGKTDCNVLYWEWKLKSLRPIALIINFLNLWIRVGTTLVWEYFRFLKVNIR